MLGKKRGSSGASSLSDPFKEAAYKWDRSHSEVGDTLRYFNSFHSSRSWCCMGDDIPVSHTCELMDRELLVSPEDLEHFQRQHNIHSEEMPHSDVTFTIGTDQNSRVNSLTTESHLKESRSPSPKSSRKKSVSILLTMPSVDLAENESGNRLASDSKRRDSSNVLLHGQPSKSALKKNSSSYSYLASPSTNLDCSDTSPKRRSASLEPHVSFHIATLKEHLEEAKSCLSLVENPVRPKGEEDCCHLCSENGTIHIVRSKGKSKKSRNLIVSEDENGESKPTKMRKSKQVNSRHDSVTASGAPAQTVGSNTPAQRCFSPTASPPVVFINSPLMVRAHVRGRPNFGRMDPALEQVHIALMARTGNKYLSINSSTMPDKIFTGALIFLTMLAIVMLFWYQNFGPGFVFKHVVKKL